MMNSDREFSQLLEEWLPYDGPHDPEEVREASQAFAALVRYLNNATRSGTSVYAPEVYTVIGA